MVIKLIHTAVHKKQTYVPPDGFIVSIPFLGLKMKHVPLGFLIFKSAYMIAKTEERGLTPPSFVVL